MKRIFIDDCFYYEETEDFNNIIKSKLGNEFLEYMEFLKYEADYTAQKVDTDLDCYEESLQSQTSAMIEIIEVSEKLINIVQSAKRMNKDNIIGYLENIIKIINNEI